MVLLGNSGKIFKICGAKWREAEDLWSDDGQTCSFLVLARQYGTKSNVDHHTK